MNGVCILQGNTFHIDCMSIQNLVLKSNYIKFNGNKFVALNKYSMKVQCVINENWQRLTTIHLTPS